MASASDCSRPNGPCTLGPGRSCMRPTTLRSNQMAMSTLVSRNTTMATALISQIHQVSLLKSAVTGARASPTILMRWPPGHAGPGARRTRSPASACRASRTPTPTAFVGSHTTWSGMSVSTTGSDERAGVGGDGQLAAVLHPDRRGGAGGDAGDGTLGGAGEERLAGLQATRVEQLVPRGEHGGTGCHGGRLGGGHVGGVDPGAVPPAELVELGVHLGQRLQAELHPEGVGEPVQHAVVGQRVRDQRLRERTRTPLPRDERAGLLARRVRPAARRRPGR